MFQRIKCLIKLHDTKLLIAKPFGNRLLSKCCHCHKYELWDMETGKSIISKNIKKFPQEVQKYIIKNNL